MRKAGLTVLRFWESDMRRNPHGFVDVVRGACVDAEAKVKRLRARRMLGVAGQLGLDL